ncbi:hypothetical protein BDV97DRAFT_353277 [Delphinella strobiligena]|nr:hypothetical protein BDV97DRAFT_353277 [Delphinella strobiligena]
MQLTAFTALLIISLGGLTLTLTSTSTSTLTSTSTMALTLPLMFFQCSIFCYDSSQCCFESKIGNIIWCLSCFFHDSIQCCIESKIEDLILVGHVDILVDIACINHLFVDHVRVDHLCVEVD